MATDLMGASGAKGSTLFFRKVFVVVVFLRTRREERVRGKKTQFHSPLSLKRERRVPLSLLRSPPFLLEYLGKKMNVFSRCPPRADEGSGQWKVGITSGIFSSVLFSVFSFVAAALLPLALITLARASSVPLFRHRHSLSPSPSYL